MYNIGSAAPSNASAASIRAWVTLITNALLAGGWIQTSDTGQTASNAFGIPAINTSAGYQIWRMGDGYQYANPVVMKIEFGGGAAANTPSIWVTVGTGSDGAGTIIGRVSPRINFKSSTNSATASNSYLCADSSSFQTIMFQNAAATIPFFFSVERSRDHLGTVSTDGVIIQGFDSSLGGQMYFLPFQGTMYTYITAICYLPPTGATSLATSNDVSLLPMIPYDLTTVYSPGLGAMIYLNADFTSNLTIPLTTGNGENHTYWTSGLVISGIYKLALRWE